MNRSASPALGPRLVPGPFLVTTISAYVAASLIANVMSIRIVHIVGFSVDAGTLCYPLTFTLRDLVHKAGGRRLARTTVLATAGCNVGMAFLLWVAARLPADPSVGPQREFGKVLVGAWRIVAASILAQVIAELIDTEIYAAIHRRLGARLQWVRVLGSNAVSIPADSVVFTLVAFAGTAAGGVLAQVIWANIVLKGLTSFASWPLIYLSPVDVAEGAAIGDPGDPETSFDVVTPVSAAVPGVVAHEPPQR
jgi:uncharacterized integral membrane protein (TIGR00697 family)